MSDFDKIQSLLQERADCNARINLIPYEGEDINVISNFLKEKCWNTYYSLDGLVTRTVYPEVPPHVEYALSETGESMRPILMAMQS